MNSKSYKRCVLGLDSGGSKCEAVLAGDDGVVIGTGRCKFSDPDSGRGQSGSGRSLESATIAVNRAMDGVHCEELLLTGTVAWVDLDFFENYHVAKLLKVVVSEASAAFALAGEETGLIVLAGTGAFVHGRTHDGQRLFLDGLGPILGDHGGGYHIGSLALRAAAKSFWHKRHETSLTDLVYKAAIGPHYHQQRREGYALVGYTLGARDRSEIASFAQLVDGEANRGDAVAQEILRTAASAIAETVYDVVDRLGMAGESYPMIAAGSIAVRSKIYWQHLCSLTKEFAPLLRPIVPDMPQVIGGMLLASESLDSTDPETFRENLYRSYKQYE